MNSGEHKPSPLTPGERSYSKIEEGRKREGGRKEGRKEGRNKEKKEIKRQNFRFPSEIFPSNFMDQ